MKVVALAGGVGGARLAHGLAQCLPAQDLTVVVNVGDDFELHGLVICPDLDTVCYTLAGLVNSSTGWGREADTFICLQNLINLGGPDWFRIGDADFATHIERTRRLRAGESLSQVTRHFCHSWGIEVHVVPVSDDAIPTWVETDVGFLSFQEYFVKHRCAPRISSFYFKDVEQAKPAPGVLESIQKADLVVICPSNPWVSIDPILALPGILETITTRCVVGVSPIIAGETVKGPAAKIFREMGISPSALAVADHYRNLFSGFVIDERDGNQTASIESLGIRCSQADILMRDAKDRQRLAGWVLDFASTLLGMKK